MSKQNAAMKNNKIGSQWQSVTVAMFRSFVKPLQLNSVWIQLLLGNKYYPSMYAESWTLNTYLLSNKNQPRYVTIKTLRLKIYSSGTLVLQLFFFVCFWIRWLGCKRATVGTDAQQQHGNEWLHSTDPTPHCLYSYANMEPPEHPLITDPPSFGPRGSQEW